MPRPLMAAKIAVHFLDRRDFVLWLGALGAEVRDDHPAVLLNPIRVDRGARRYARCVWHLGATTRGAKAPRMEGADDVIALDAATIAEVGAEMRTVRVE